MPPDPLVGWGGGHPLTIPFPLTLTLPLVDFGAFGASVVRPPTQIPGYAYGPRDLLSDGHLIVGVCLRLIVITTFDRAD